MLKQAWTTCDVTASQNGEDRGSVFIQAAGNPWQSTKEDCFPALPSRSDRIGAFFVTSGVKGLA